MITLEMVANFPELPGVYLMKNELGTVLYVGKALNLKKRVRCYTGNGETRQHIRIMTRQVAAVDFIVTDTEKEALILENTLIKQHRPKYNINLRDDKTYFSLRMDPQEQYPRLSLVRKVPADGARYFGPYSSASSAKQVLKQLYKLFPLRHHQLSSCLGRKRPCLYHQIKQCCAPCCGLVGSEEYAGIAAGAALFLEGRNHEVTRIYREKMQQASATMRYEEAARYRDLIRSIEVTVEKQKVVSGNDDCDVFGLHRTATSIQISVLHIRGGALTGSNGYHFDWLFDDGDALASFLGEYYSQGLPPPARVMTPLNLPEREGLQELLSEKAGKKVRIDRPVRGKWLDLLGMAHKNAVSWAEERAAKAESREALLCELKDKLALPRLPRRIECYDISNIQGEMAVGSRVVFIDGKPANRLYRRYRIKTVLQSDDFAMMNEVLTRRFSADNVEQRPDLIVVDGGLGQLGVLNAILEQLQIEDVAAAGLAKSRVESDMQGSELSRSDERVFRPGRKNPVVLRQNSPALLLLAQIRDEAHRFAVTYHKKVRSKQMIASELDRITGIGPLRKKALLSHFGSLKQVKLASIEQLTEVRGMSPTDARRLWDALHSTRQADRPH